MRIRLRAASLLLAAWVAPVAAEPLQGRVSEVIDGDTLRIEFAGRDARILQLAWIDAPAPQQAHGDAARASLSALVMQRDVRVELSADARGQVRATLWVVPPDAPCRNDTCPKTLDVAHAQLTRGMAWHDRRSLGQQPQSFAQYEQAELYAKLRRIGLWSAQNPVPPWQWRH